jgi:hypothetical protein
MTKQKSNDRMMKAMRRRIALQSTSCENAQERPDPLRESFWNAHASPLRFYVLPLRRARVNVSFPQ